MVTLYSTGCPKCKVLTKKMKEKNIDYDEIEDVELIKNKGFMQVPILEVDGKVMDFGEAVKWINRK